MHIKSLCEKTEGFYWFKKINKIIEDKALIEMFYQPRHYSDEPKLWQYSSKIADITRKSDSRWDAGYGGGASFNKSKAIIKAVGEALERYCLGFYKEKDLLRTSYKDLKGKCLSLEKVVSFSDSQFKKKSFSNCCWNNEDIFFWVKGHSFFKKKTLYIPAQLVFVPYNFRKEKIIRLPISTGGAAGTSLSSTLFRGALEIIERDAFMIHYLSCSLGELIDFSDESFLLRIKNYFKKYRLDLYLINLPTDIKVYNFLALIVDKTGVGPAVSAGLKSGLDPLKVALGAIEESWHSRPWIRDDLNKLPNLEKILSEGKKLTEIKKRGLFWSSVKMIKHIEPWIKNKRKIRFVDLSSFSSGKMNRDLKYLLGLLKKTGHEIYYVDVTRPEVARHGFVVLKVIIPTLQPLYLDEPYPYLGGERLYILPAQMGFRKRKLKEEQINKVPHFFL